jgi:hypothetical protein
VEGARFAVMSVIWILSWESANLVCEMNEGLLFEIEGFRRKIESAASLLTNKKTRNVDIIKLSYLPLDTATLSISL